MFHLEPTPISLKVSITNTERGDIGGWHFVLPSLACLKPWRREEKPLKRRLLEQQNKERKNVV